MVLSTTGATASIAALIPCLDARCRHPFLHLIVTVVRLARPGGLRSVVAESLLVKHQLRILNRGRKRSPNLRASGRFIAGLCTLFMNPARVLRSAIVLKPSTLLRLHDVLANRKPHVVFAQAQSKIRGRQRASGRLRRSK
jgi:putative transposase